MALDPAKTIHDAAWTLLTARSGWTSLFLPGNRLNAASMINVPLADQIKQAPSDFPKITIDVQQDDDGQRGPRVFGMNNTSFSASTVDYPVPVRVQLRIRIVHDTTALSDQLAAENQTRAALLTKGPQMGVSWVRSSILSTRRRIERSPDTGNTRRTVSDMTLTVEGEPMLSLLVA